ncbi:DUF2624 domain-containing protein [Bacillus fonticola]|uniref:DUF2624 domain-containing protein n=1 Tax=Bacillus fonticola TaxID=2728853 RepID=UPI001472927B|nr:DUF2624 domain-containing protein [Bacillus fonticola]
MKLFEHVVNHKLSTITPSEIQDYGNEYDISLTNEQASSICNVIHSKKWNIFDSRERTSLIKEIAKITGPNVARQANQLFLQLTKQG